MARLLAHYHPTNYSQWYDMGMNMGVGPCAFQGLLAGLVPNPQRPSLYNDFLYEWVNGQPVLSESADQRCQQGDVQNGDLPRYVLQPVRLKGIKIVHGTADANSPVIGAREFTNALRQAGVPFEYEEHSGRHDYRADLALPFLSSHLQGAERYIAPPRLTLSRATNGFQVAFPTLTNVLYAVESAAGLETSGTNWAERSRVTGDGQTATAEIPCEREVQFIRIKAVNLP